MIAFATIAACGGTVVEEVCPPGWSCTPPCDADCGDDYAPDVGSDVHVDGSVDAELVDSSDAAVDAPYEAEAEAATPPAPPPPPAVTAGTVLLSHNVIDAELSTGLWSVVTISDTPSNALYIYDVGTKTERTVSLPTTPVAVGVDVSGLMAAVAYDAHVSWIDLKSGTIKATCALSSNAYDVALSFAGTAYVVPRTDQWVPLHAVDLTTCTETTASTIRAGSHLVMHPTEQAVVTADQGLSPSRIHRCDLTKTPIVCDDAQGNNDWGTYDYCGNLWPSSDGARVYTACGVALTLASPVNAGNATYGGTLPGEPFVQQLCEAPQAGDGGLIALVPDLGWSWNSTYDASADTVVNIHDAVYLGFVKQQALPPLPTDAGNQPAHGRFVFTTPTMNALFVVVQNGAIDAGTTFAIETILL